MRRTALLLALLLGAALLAACGGSAGASQSQDGTILTEDYTNALSIQGQLALGTVQLDSTEAAVDETQAAALLPLWQALQTLSTSDTTAQAEVDGLVRQIEGAMTQPQLEAIAAMALTSDSMTELAQSGALNLGGFGRQGGAGAGGTSAGSGDFPAPPEGFAGGPPGGGFGGGAGGPGGGFGGDFAGGGFPDAGTLSEDDIATRQARFAGGDFESRALIGMVVRLLETKTGQAPAVADIPGTVLAAVASTTGLEPADIQATMAEGTSLAQILTDSGADPAAVRAAVIAALEALPNGADLDAAGIADRFLGGG